MKGTERGKAKKKSDKEGRRKRRGKGKELVWYNQYRSTHGKDQSNIEKGGTQHLQEKRRKNRVESEKEEKENERKQ